VNGAQALIRTLVGAGVDVCFANPGTSEMHFVAALDDVPEMRGVLTLFEGVATGAADGWARMTGRPAATLLHLGPGLGNGLANLHNARRARTPVVNVVGDHARSHKRLDAPLESDVDALAGTVSGWVRRSLTPEDLGADAADAVAGAARGQIATLLLPADVSWSEGAAVADPPPSWTRPVPPGSRVSGAAAALRSGEPAVLLLGGDVVASEDGLLTASAVAASTGARLLAETFPARMVRGAGLPDVGRLPYPPEVALKALAGTRHLVLAGATSPVHFFGYPGVPGTPVPEDCTVHLLSEPGEDGVAALGELAEVLSANDPGAVLEASRPEVPGGRLTPRAVSAVVGAVLPERAVVVDEAITSGIGLAELTSGAPRHDWLSLTGGAIGHGLPVAVGAAVACPDRPVLALQADGSAMYTVQALWTMAREQLDVTVLLYDNASYAILQGELARVGAAGGGERAGQLLDLGGPALDFVALATGMGVPATRAETTGDLADQLRTALREPGPHLVVAALRPGG
jgi:acetolactate synthase-1/2/3 large subunit